MADMADAARLYQAAVQLERVDRELRAMRDTRPGCGQAGCPDSSAHVHAVQVARVLPEAGQ